MGNKISIFIDNCAWDFLFNSNINLSTEFPREEFVIMMTKEVAAFEVISIPDDKKSLKDYIRLQKENCGIVIDSLFGFSSYNDPPNYRPRVGGFGEGRWVSDKEAKFLEHFKVKSGKERKTGLFNNEADASLAVRACTGSIVLTAESKTKNGPLKEALKLGGKVVYLNDFDPSKISLRKFVVEQFPPDDLKNHC